MSSCAEFGNLAGKLLVGSEEYSFAAVAAPYAQELLDLQSARSFAITEFGKQVTFCPESPSRAQWCLLCFLFIVFLSGQICLAGLPF